MRQVTKQIQQDVTVDVCDICGNEEIVIEWNAYYSCPSDGCYDGRNVYHFCSFGHLLEYVKQRGDAFPTMGVDDIANNTLTLELKGQGFSDVTEFLLALKNA